MAEWRRYEPAEVLEGGCPPLPGPPMPIDLEVPVAVWRQGDLGAVLELWTDPDPEVPEDPTDIVDPHDLEITAYRREPNGSWSFLAGGGSSWPMTFGERATHGLVGLEGFSLGFADGERGVCLAAGIAGEGVVRVRVERGAIVEEVEVHPIVGAFIVGGEHGDALRLTALDASGAAMGPPAVGALP